MSTIYTPPGVDVEVLDNPRLINLGEAARITAIVGMGPITRIVTDEAIVRGTGSIDYLANYPGTGFSVSQIAAYPGLYSGLINYTRISQGGGLYNISSASINASGYITWPVGGSFLDVPSAGTTYYASYTFDVPDSQYTPTLFNDKQMIKAKYGAESVSTGILSVAGSINLENGPPAVLLCQAQGSSYNEQAYKDAIDKLKKYDFVEQVVVVFPSGSVTRAQQETILTYAFNHVLQMTQSRKERGLVSGSPSSSYASGGFDTIGTPATTGTYTYRSTAIKQKNSVYAVPSICYRVDESGNTMLLDGNFAAAAIAGKQCAQRLRSTPITGMSITGITMEDEKWNDSDMNFLASNGCLVLQSKSGIITIRDAITTDPANADTQEMSVISQERLVKRSLRNGLENTYKGKGKVILPTTPNDVIATTEAILRTLVKEGEIYGYGTIDDPITGETKISAKQNSSEPRAIDVTCSVKYLYPLKWIKVTVSTYV